MRHPLTLQPKRFHLALHPGMRMVVAFVVEALLFRFGELKLDHGLFINQGNRIKKIN
jgi:hypothetical protein